MFGIATAEVPVPRTFTAAALKLAFTSLSSVILSIEPLDSNNLTEKSISGRSSKLTRSSPEKSTAAGALPLVTVK